METSPFNRLPPELRTRIYEHIFTFDSVRCQDGRWRVYAERKVSRLAARLAPTLVCRQMRAETLHLLMALNELVCGNEDGDVDPYYEFWLGACLLKDPCEWASRALGGGRSPFLSASTVFRLHLWVYPCMRDLMRVEDWREVEDAFAGLVDGGRPGRVVVTLHFYVDYQPLSCECMQQQEERQGKAGLPRFEYGEFEIRLDGCGLGNTGIVKLFDEKREGLNVHESHDHVPALCGKLSEQLDQTEEMAVRVVEMAQGKRVGRVSLVHS